MHAADACACMRGSSHCVQMHWLAHPAARLGLVVDGQHDLIHARSLQGLQMQRRGSATAVALLSWRTTA